MGPKTDVIIEFKKNKVVIQKILFWSCLFLVLRCYISDSLKIEGLDKGSPY